MLLLAGTQILGGHIHDAVGINIEGNLNLRHTPAGGRDAVQMEHTQRLIILGKLPLTLQYMDFHRGLIIHSRGENLALLGGDSGISLDYLGAYAAESFNTE